MRAIILCLLVLTFFSCKKKQAPDVSNITINTQTLRFEEDLFQADTNHIAATLTTLEKKYGDFFGIYMQHILGVNPIATNEDAGTQLKTFIRDYKPVYDTTQKIYKQFGKYDNRIKKVLAYTKYYFPSYKIPQKVITYIGPLDGYGDAVAENALLIGLHHHIDSSYSQYAQPWLVSIYPHYISQNFMPDYIDVNAAKNIIDDIYPDTLVSSNLLTVMVENGKRLYAAQALVPNADAYKIMGYTPKQFTETMKHQKAIWNFFTQYNLLQSTDKSSVKKYTSPSPKTQELGEAAPGNLGSFTGWQIVNKYMEKYDTTRLQTLLQTPADAIYTAAKYKP